MIIEHGPWIRFDDRLPSERDADKRGNLELQEIGGRIRVGLWNWVDTASLWKANGFVAWRQNK